MAEFFTEAQLAILAASTVRADFVVKFDFATTGTKYAWNGNTPLVIGANTYLPMKGYGVIEGLGHGDGTQSQSVTLSLDGLPDQALDFLTSALADTPEVDQQPVTISLVLFDSDWQPVGSPLPVWFGYMQPPRISRTPMRGTEGGTQSVTIVAENVFFNRSRPPYGRYTDRDQQGRSPGDKFFGFVSSLLNKTITYPDF
ncbi:hypothetical protein [Allomesorhizobium camelthorni]|uniref:Uncharacterized protein n=1 Tax=Allomesorhizobium camelthorni TaxID=475069 RepID=A0A6G4WBJ5_9HYPH|nr:hypothetical protein [Mesorhizobium camelthorni]NGO51606.1 hypothetical protein [Mesorhizobium camelthorni]